MIVLGLDMGVASMGWALIEIDEHQHPVDILALGSRVVPLAEKEDKNFSVGKGVSIRGKLTLKRGLRRGYQRFEMRRDYLHKRLNQLGMYDPDNAMLDIAPLDLWKMRADAATPGICLSLLDIGRVLRHINHKRGYRHSKESTDNAESSKETEYVGYINARYAELKSAGLTLGQYHYRILKDSIHITPKGSTIVTGRLKDGDPYTPGRLLPRIAHIEEFDRIMDVQRVYYPDILTSEVIKELRHIIFHQRALKSSKHLVSNCEFIQYAVKSGDKIRMVGPKVAPRTSPIAELTRIYEIVNNIKLSNLNNQVQNCGALEGLFDKKELCSVSREWRLRQREYLLDEEERRRIVNFLNTNSHMTSKDLLKELGLKKSDGFSPNMASGTKLKGNETRVKFAEILSDYPQHQHLLEFELDTVQHVDDKTGEIICEISENVYSQPYYRLWHLIYSVTERKDFERALAKQFDITEPELVEKLYGLNLTAPGFSARSAKFMRRILPYLMQGEMYSRACALAGFNHSNSLTKQENESRQLSDKIELLKQGELRQPTVEKIVNQAVNLVNSLIARYGYIDEIRVELARELKQNKKTREQAALNIAARENINGKHAKAIAELGITQVTRKQIQKYHMWKETGGRCMYCGSFINIKEFLVGVDADVEHVIPRTLLFDNSISNKVCSCRHCNDDKGKTTAFDFMTARGEKALQEYLVRVKEMSENPEREYRISNTKYKRLLTAGSEIPRDFLERDLRQTQYICRKTMDLMRNVCHKVYATTGCVTDFLRHIWGYDNILHELNLPRYEKVDMADDKIVRHNETEHKRRRINNWTKRLDHRHHAIDALVVALTRQKYIQRLNNLNVQHDNMRADIDANGFKFQHNKCLLEQWVKSCPHFKVAEVMACVDAIAVSYKPGKKVATTRKNMASKDGTPRYSLVPRGELHEETIYGKIHRKTVLKTLSETLKNLDSVVDASIKTAIMDALAVNCGDVKATLKWLKKNPIPTSTGEPIVMVRCYEDNMVVRYAVEDLKDNIINADDVIIDTAVRRLIQKRRAQCKTNSAFKASVKSEPIYMDADKRIPIKRVRCKTNVSTAKALPVRIADGKVTGYAKSGNNHHISFYRTIEGKVVAMTTSFWEAVHRMGLGLPVIIRNPAEAWNHIMSLKEDDRRIGFVVPGMPDHDWKFVGSMSLNEMFILGLSEDEWNDAINSNDYKTLTSHMYRVQQISQREFVFSLHHSTDATIDAESKKLKNKIVESSYSSLSRLNPHKVRVDITGLITPVYD